MSSEQSASARDGGGGFGPPSPGDALRLVELEQVIERGQQTFVEVGRALAEIRDAKLYRRSHRTFEGYCSERWQMTDAHARQLILSAETVTVVTVDDVPAPSSESVARALKGTPEQKKAAWRETVRRFGPKPTAAQTREVVEETMPSERRKKNAGGEDTKRRSILLALARSRERGLTREQLTTATGQTAQTVTGGTMLSLLNDGLVVASGQTRSTSSGKPAEVLLLSRQGQQALLDAGALTQADFDGWTPGAAVVAPPEPTKPERRGKRKSRVDRQRYKQLSLKELRQREIAGNWSQWYRTRRQVVQAIRALGPYVNAVRWRSAPLDEVEDTLDDLLELREWTEKAIIGSRKRVGEDKLREKLDKLSEVVEKHGAEPGEVDNAKRAAARLKAKLDAA